MPDRAASALQLPAVSLAVLLWWFWLYGAAFPLVILSVFLPTLVMLWLCNLSLQPAQPPPPPPPPPWAQLRVNPSNLMNLFTYEKGYCFVYYLSQLCGDPIRFDAFLRAYIEKYKFRSVVAQDLLDSFLDFFPELKEKCIDNKTGLEFEHWLNETGPPLIEPDLSQGSSLTSPVEMLFDLWTTEPLHAVAAANSVNMAEWQTFQTVLFLDRLLDGSPLPQVYPEM